MKCSNVVGNILPEESLAKTDWLGLRSWGRNAQNRVQNMVFITSYQ